MTYKSKSLKEREGGREIYDPLNLLKLSVKPIVGNNSSKEREIEWMVGPS